MKIKCWCGEEGDIDELCEDVPGACCGTGMLECLCGGDFCVCHNHGEIECPGCEDCRHLGLDDVFEIYDVLEPDDDEGFPCFSGEVVIAPPK